MEACERRRRKQQGNGRRLTTSPGPAVAAAYRESDVPRADGQRGTRPERDAARLQKFHACSPPVRPKLKRAMSAPLVLEPATSRVPVLLAKRSHHHVYTGRGG